MNAEKIKIFIAGLVLIILSGTYIWSPFDSNKRWAKLIYDTIPSLVAVLIGYPSAYLTLKSLELDNSGTNNISAGSQNQSQEINQLQTGVNDILNQINQLHSISPASGSGISPDSITENYKKLAALYLFTLWHSPQIRKSRIFVSEWTKNNQNKVPSLSEIENQGGDVEIHVFELIHFLEQWAILAQYNQLDCDFITKKLASYLVWYDTNLIQPISKADERNQDFINLLALIKREVFTEDMYQYATLK